MKKIMTLFLLMGLAYMDVEVIYGAAVERTPSLTGQSSVWMGLVGGSLGVLLGLFNEKYSLLGGTSYRLKVLAGAGMITLIELLSGLILNVWLGLGIWDYSSSALHVMGQIDWVHSLCWLAFTPFVFWYDDVLRHYIYEEERPETLAMYYLRALVPSAGKK
jgi:hypothetical protein